MATHHPDGGAADRILDALRKQYPASLAIVELRLVAGIDAWSRRVRELRSAGWQIMYSAKGKSYRLLSQEKAASSVQGTPLSAKQRYRVLARDHSVCRRCGVSPTDGAKLVVDHIVPREWG